MKNTGETIGNQKGGIMRKRILMISLVLILILATGCGNENLNGDDNTEKIEETESKKFILLKLLP